MAKETKAGLGWGNVNGMSAEDDRTCALNDMNCLENQEEKTYALTDMNAAAIVHCSFPACFPGHPGRAANLFPFVKSIPMRHRNFKTFPSDFQDLVIIDN